MNGLILLIEFFYQITRDTTFTEILLFALVGVNVLLLILVLKSNKLKKIMQREYKSSELNKKIAEAKIKRLSFYDPLTDLPNRAFFNQLIKELILNKQYKYFSLFYIDIDNFKSVNDSLDHSYGDTILCNVANILKNQINCKYELIRFGGDEFVIIAYDLQNNQELKSYAEGILSGFQSPFNIEGLDYYISLSIGIATYPYDGKTAEELLKRADIALNDVKINSKNGYKIFSAELDASLEKKLKLERDLRSAIEYNQFKLYYQPQFNMEHNRVLGYEALIRWNHPENGMMYPDEFIPIAEETGLIIPIGEWVIYQAAKQLKDWQLQGFDNLSIAINLSAKQFMDGQLVDYFKRIISEFNIDCKKLELEITESTALYDIEHASYVLTELKALGFKVSLDDFGTGYSSLNYLTQLPIDHVKIDKSFIKHIIMKKYGKQIIRSVIELAHACNLKVVAEGVETKGQLEFLRNEKCDMIQGFYLSEPVPNYEAICYADISAI